MSRELHLLRPIRPHDLTVDRPLDYNVTGAIREQVSTLTPEQQAILDRNEHRAGIRFVRQLKDYLSPQQKRYMRTSRTISTRMNLDEDLNWWDEQLEKQEGLGETPLNGMIYHSYDIVSLQNDGSTTSGVTIGRHVWAGRAPFVATPSDIVHADDVLGKELPEGKDAIEMMKLMKEKIALRRQQASMGKWIAVSIHEKIHGIQNHRLALPILEIVAHYYEREFMRAQGWEPRGNKPFQGAVEYWDGLVKKYGDRLHKFVFGNLAGEEEKVMRDALLAEFSPEVMEQIFPKPTDDESGVVWETTSI